MPERMRWRPRTALGKVYIERLRPANGLLAISPMGSCTNEMIGSRFGGGTYQLTRAVAGSPLMTTRIIIDERLYGPPRLPNS